MTDTIRTVALAVCHDGRGRILVERGYDRVRDEPFLRAIGGGVEFGERAVEALAREWREELGLELKAPALLGVLENRFTSNGRAGHEVIFVFAARLADADGPRARRDRVDGAGREPPRGALGAHRPAAAGAHALQARRPAGPDSIPLIPGRRLKP
jgi:ADP-ribose pyrophosphatase YjhB (NUDIX family)